MGTLTYSPKASSLMEFQPRIVVGSLASTEIDKSFGELSKYSAQLSRPQEKQNSASLDAVLYDSKAEFKIYASQASMHFGREWLDKLFQQIDNTLDVEEWDQMDPPPKIGTIRTFIRMLLTVKSRRRPGMGISNNGNLIASWTKARNRLTIECMPGDRVRWVLSRSFGEEVERAAGDGKIGGLIRFLSPYDPSIWFENAQ